MKRRTFLASLAATSLASGARLPANAQQGPIKLGEINSYTRMAAFTEPYKKGWQLAVEEINSSGGIKGRQLEVTSRDDLGEPATALRVAEEMVAKDNVAMLFGTFLSNVGLAVSDFAKQKKVLFLASEPLTDAIIWSEGNKYTFRLRPSTHMQAAMLAKEAAQLKATRWVTISPNYAYGTDAVTAFKKELTRLNPKVQFVEEQWPTLFKIDAGSTVRALEAAKPEAIYNVTFGGDLTKFVREGNQRGLFKDRPVVSLLTGEPEYLDPLGDETPNGWLVTGYPVHEIKTPEHDKFKAAYQKRWSELPKTGSIVGYNSILTIAALFKAAPAADVETLIKTMRGLKVESSPTGPFFYRPADHQATMGAYVGKTAYVNGKPTMSDWYYADGNKFLPSEEEAAKLRPKE